MRKGRRKNVFSAIRFIVLVLWTYRIFLDLLLVGGMRTKMWWPPSQTKKKSQKISLEVLTLPGHKGEHASVA